MFWNKGKVLKPKNTVPSVEHGGSSINLNLNPFYGQCLKATACQETNQLNQSDQFCQQQWSNIQPEMFQKLVDDYQKLAKGHLTEY